jgi:hypothetical protein
MCKYSIHLSCTAPARLYNLYMVAVGTPSVLLECQGRCVMSVQRGFAQKDDWLRQIFFAVCQIHATVCSRGFPLHEPFFSLPIDE